jgi:hypothetical protein
MSEENNKAEVAQRRLLIINEICDSGDDPNC